MLIKKKKIILAIAILVIGGIYFAYPGVKDYYEWRQVANAVSGMPWQDGGTITNYTAGCYTQYPSGNCSCSMCRAACDGHDEIQMQGQQKTMFICPTVGFQYKGGGTTPKSGAYIIAGGASNILPWVIGISK